MRWFSLTRKATGFTRHFLNLEQYHHHGHGRLSLSLNSGSHFLSTLKSTASEMQPSSLFPIHLYSTTVQTDTESLHRINEISVEKLDLEVISMEIIKPSSPTPYHLRTFNLSIIDQLYLKFYTPFIVFVPNTDKDVITKRLKILKDSLSELLTQYYPFAGEINDNLHIECNDKGVYFVEARVNQTLNDFLHQPDDQKVRELIPKYPNVSDSSLGNHIMSVQVNLFDCGGIALSTSMSHKLVDGHSYFRFMNAWAATARGSAEKISPSFMASELFPNNPSFKYSLPSKLLTTKLPIAKRFVFDSSAVASLKAKHVAAPSIPRGPTRVEAIGALIWKAAAKAASSVRPFGPQSPHVLLSLVNMRNKASPPLPHESIGNIIGAAIGICFPDNQPDLLTLMGQIRESISKINSDYIDTLKGENGHHNFTELMKIMAGLFDMIDEGDCLLLSSLFNNGIYEIDFGWGKPIWFRHLNGGSPRNVTLSDTLKAGCVETVVSLSPEEMEIFKADPEILAYTTMDPSPLGYLN